jgi:putative membrane protein
MMSAEVRRVPRESFLMSFVIRWVVTTAAIGVTAWILQDYVHVANLSAVILAGLVLGLLNALVRPIAIFLTLPLTVLTLGLFIFVINAFMLWLTTLVLGESFRIEGWGWLFLASLLISLVSAILNRFVRG